MQPKLTALAVVTPVYKHAALGGFIEAANKVDYGALACAGLANQGYRLARLNVQIEVLQHLFAFLIGKAYVLEIDIALYGLPVFALGVEAVAVFGDYLGGIHYFARSIDERYHALRACLRALHFRQNARKLLNGFKEVGGIRYKRGKRAERDYPAHNVYAAAVQRYRRAY